MDGKINILAIDTSCDETAAAVTRGTKILANIIWSQAALHAKFGGVMPALAQRMHRERIDWVIERAIKKSGIKTEEIGAVAVTAGPGLAIALEVGIAKAKELAEKWGKPLLGINHTEGHLLSPLARSKETRDADITSEEIFPAWGVVVSGGHTEIIAADKPGKYTVLAKTSDDALGEALDKAARMLGLGYPGGAILEKMARSGKKSAYPLPLPMARQGTTDWLSYSGLKTAMYRLIGSMGNDLSEQQICDLAASFQNRAFQHLERVVSAQIKKANNTSRRKYLLAGGGVIANIELRRRLRRIAKENNLRLLVPYSLKLTGDNAAMIGVAAAFKTAKLATDFTAIDRLPRWSIEEV